MGERFAGRYELVEVLGDGGMGTVWRVWDHRDGQYRAAKMLKQSDSAALLRFVRETSWRIDHPHVVTVIGWSAEDDRALFTMPLVGGGTVATLTRDFGALPGIWVAELLGQLLSALEAVHAAGLVHRDVKPSNLLLDPTGTGRPYLRLSDFGIAAAVDDPRLTRVGESIGTPGYQAPEVERGADPDPRQDLYAAGMVALELLTGQRPAPGGHHDHRIEPVSTVGIAGSSLGPVVDRLVRVDPGQRFSSAAEARAALDKIQLTDADRSGAEEIEVFDQLPQLPEGWGRNGPVGRSSSPPSIPAFAPNPPPDRARYGSPAPAPAPAPALAPAPAPGPVPARVRLPAIAFGLIGTGLLLIIVAWVIIVS